MNEVYNLKIQKKKRQYLRNNATRAEKILWQKLKSSQFGYKFRRQYGIGRYIVDFYCPELRLVIELDGDVHNFKKQRAKDLVRDDEIGKLNLKIVRYNNFDVLENLQEVLENLNIICEELDSQRVY